MATFFVVVELRYLIALRSLSPVVYVAVPFAVLVRIVLAAGVAEAMVHKLEVTWQGPLGKLWSSGGVLAMEIVVVLTWLQSTASR